MNKNKVKMSAYIDENIIMWIDKKSEEKIFASRNHAINLALARLKEYFETTEQNRY